MGGKVRHRREGRGGLGPMAAIHKQGMVQTVGGPMVQEATRLGNRTNNECFRALRHCTPCMQNSHVGRYRRVWEYCNGWWHPFLNRDREFFDLMKLPELGTTLFFDEEDPASRIRRTLPPRASKGRMTRRGLFRRMGWPRNSDQGLKRSGRISRCQE